MRVHHEVQPKCGTKPGLVALHECGPPKCGWTLPRVHVDTQHGSHVSTGWTARDSISIIHRITTSTVWEQVRKCAWTWSDGFAQRGSQRLHPQESSASEHFWKRCRLCTMPFPNFHGYFRSSASLARGAQCIDGSLQRWFFFCNFR